MRKISFLLAFLCAGFLYAQKTMTPELLWQVNRVSPVGISDDGKVLFYKVTIPNMEENIKYIVQKLDDNERSNIIRLMKSKEIILHKGN